jgi:hypothetical protein
MRGVRPDIFPVPSGVVFGRRAGKPAPLPADALAFAGSIAPRGTRWADAGEKLTSSEGRVERGSDDGSVSVYATRFYQGATILPRVLLTVRELPTGPLGTPTGNRRVGSLRSSLEKKPWKELDSLEGLIEEQFLYPAYVGISIAPFRPLEPIQAVIPWASGGLLDGGDSKLDTYPNLAAWWRRAEQLWDDNKGAKNNLSLKDRLDYHGGLRNQYPIQPDRVVYTKSGNRITAARIQTDQAVIDHKLYWAAVNSADEGRYLTTILNSEAVHKKVEPLMSEGLFGKRDIDKYVFAVPFPIFDPDSELHAHLTEAGARAEEVAGAADLSDDPNFQTARRRVREALGADGVADDIETLVGELLEPVAVPV